MHLCLFLALQKGLISRRASELLWANGYTDVLFEIDR